MRTTAISLAALMLLTIPAGIAGSKEDKAREREEKAIARQVKKDAQDAAKAYGPREHPKWRAFGEAVDRIGSQAIMGNVCPKVYRTPFVFMTPEAWQWVRVCDANGYMAFGFYVYTGVGPTN